MKQNSCATNRLLKISLRMRYRAPAPVIGQNRIPIPGKKFAHVFYFTKGKEICAIFLTHLEPFFVPIVFFKTTTCPKT